LDRFDAALTNLPAYFAPYLSQTGLYGVLELALVDIGDDFGPRLAFIFSIGRVFSASYQPSTRCFGPAFPLESFLISA